jgi:YHS domain-containing protein
MTVDPATSQHRFDHRGETFHFCSAGCRAKFAADPKQYLDNSKPKAAVPEGTIYTCPMHPQIRQIGPGKLPDLRHGAGARGGILDAPPNPELADMTRRFWIGAALSIPASCWRWAVTSSAVTAGSTRPCRTGSSWCSPHPSCSGPGGRSSCAAGNRW